MSQRNESFLSQHLGSIAAAALLAACTAGGVVEQPTGNDELGIARFVISEGDARTTVVGLDADSVEVARVELIHGQFALTGPFRDDYETPQVVGRKLDVTIEGQLQMVWETAGFDPTLELPAPDARLAKLTAFLEDPHVTAVLDPWQIGFAPLAAELEETGYTYGYNQGTSPTDCSSPATSCGTAQGKTINTCGGGYPASSAKRVTRSSPYSEYILAQCCPAGSGGGQPDDWFGVKSCPLSGSTGSCGTGSGACKACPLYPVDGSGWCGVATYADSGSYRLNWCFESSGPANNTLSITLAGTGIGVVKGGPGIMPWNGIFCGDGHTNCSTNHACDGIKVKLTAFPDAYSTFAGWNGTPGCNGSTNPVCWTFLSASTQNVTATFNSSPF